MRKNPAYFNRMPVCKISLFFILLIVSLLVQTGCNSPEKKSEALDQKPLSEEEKHLPENALRGIKWPDDVAAQAQEGIIT